jgi:hypothetical protein
MLINLSSWPKRRRPNTTESRTAPKLLSDTQWRIIKDLFEDPDPSLEGGRPRVDARACLEGILVDAQEWSSLARFSSKISIPCDLLATTQGMDRSGAVAQGLGESDSNHRSAKVARLIAGDGRRHLFACKKWGLEVGKDQKGKGKKLMLLTEAHGIPISALTTSAQVAEVHTIETLVDLRVTKGARND